MRCSIVSSSMRRLRCASKKAAGCGTSSSTSAATSLLAFMEAREMPGVPADYDAGINRGLGVPAAFYHFAFDAGSEAGLAAKRDQLRAKGLIVTDVVDHGWARSIYFKDPNGLSLEYCCTVRDLTNDDAVMQERGTIPRATLEMGDEGSDEISRVQSARANATTRSADGRNDL